MLQSHHIQNIQNADLRAVETQSTPRQRRGNVVESPLNAVRSHRSPGDGAHFEHAQNKRRGNVVLTRAHWDLREVAVAAQLQVSYNAVGSQWALREILECINQTK